MTKYEFAPGRQTLIITSEGGKKYNLYFHSKGVTIAHGTDGSGGTIYESPWLNFSQIPADERLNIMWTYVEAAVASVNGHLIELFISPDALSDMTDEDAVEAINKRRIGISRFNEMADVIRTYLIERSNTF